MDSLPDDLVLAILGLLEDGRTLLDVVPLVCRRWRRLSWHPEAWAGVVLRWQPCSADYSQCTDDDHADVDQSARVLLHAPALRRFVVDDRTFQCEVCSYEVRRLRSATLRTEAAVRDVWLGDHIWHHHHLSDGGSMEVEDALLDFIVRCHSSLRFLELGTLASSPRMEDTLCRLDRLESLGLDLELADDRSWSWGALRSALPRLERLELSGCSLHSDGGIAVDLVGGAAATLRTLRIIHCFLAPCPAFVAALCRCQRLRELACDVYFVGMLRALLPQLATLELRLERWSSTATLSAATDALSGCSVAGLLCLRLNLLGFGRSLSEWSQFLRLVEALSYAAPSLRALDVDMTGRALLDGDFAVPFVTLVVVHWPGLRSVTLDLCSVDVVRRLAALPFLEDLSATVSCLREECSCVADVAALQRQRPALRTALRVHQH